MMGKLSSHSHECPRCGMPWQCGEGRVPVSHQDALHEVLGSRTGKSWVSTGSQRMSINYRTVAYQREKQLTSGA